MNRSFSTPVAVSVARLVPSCGEGQEVEDVQEEISQRPWLSEATSCEHQISLGGGKRCAEDAI